jgi:hypothetical protein
VPETPESEPLEPQDHEPSSGDGPTGDAAPGDVRELVLVKNGQRYVFRYTPGEENKLLTGLADMARDPKSELNWFDAAVLSHQMGRAISQQLERLKKSS